METLFFGHFSEKNTGLNRTMQYGNIFSKPKIRLMKKKFKSYYVVWKLVGVVAGGLLRAVFKSYYVVWKLLKNKK